MPTAPDPLDPAEVPALLERMRPRLRAILARHAIAPSDAEDLLQDTFLALCVSWDQIKNKEAWLSGTLRLLCCSYWRKRKRMSLESIDPALLETLPQLSSSPRERADLLLDLQAVIARLSPRYRRLLRLRYGLGLNLAELTVRFGTTPDHLRKLTSRALTRARRLGERGELNPARRGKRPR